MRNCPECGTAVGDTWEYCLRCGEALPAPVVATPSGVAGVLARLGVKRQPRQLPDDDAYAAGTQPAGARAAFQRFWDARVPLWIAAAVGLVLSVALLLAVFVLPGGSAGLDEARAAEAAALQDVDRLDGELQQVRADLAAAQERADTAEADLAALQEQASASEGTLAEAQEEAAGLRAQLDEANTELEARQVAIDSGRQHVELLQECVSGMEVVVQFARNGLFNQAAQAEEVIQPVCEQARTFEG